jgi:hypothetical protein
VLRCDGLLPAVMPSAPDEYGTAKPDDIRAIRQWLAEQGKPADFDVISEGETPHDDASKAREQVALWEEAGCTWWLETRWSDPGNQGARGDEVRQRIEAGPPAAG